MNAKEKFLKWWEEVEKSAEWLDGNALPEARFVLFCGTVYLTAKELREIVAHVKATT